MYSNPDDAAAIVAETYQLDLKVARDAIGNLTASRAPRPYWGEGRFDVEALAGNYGVFHDAESCYLLALLLRKPR